MKQHKTCQCLVYNIQKLYRKTEEKENQKRKRNTKDEEEIKQDENRR